MRVGPLASAVLAVSVMLSAGLDARAGAVPRYIRTYESVTAAFARSGGPGTAIVAASLTALGERFDLILEPSTILADNATTILVDNSGSHQAPAPKQLYSGHLADDAQAQVRVSIEAGALDGYVRRGGLTYFLEPLSRYLPDAAGRTLVYRESDLDPSALPAVSCATEERAAHPGNGATARGAIAMPPRQRGSGLGLLQLTLVADFAMYRLHGAATADYMLGIINQVDGFYVTNLGVTLQVVATVIYTSQGIEPFSATSVPVNLLQDLAAARAAGGLLSGGGATHLLTGRDLTGSVIGVAYLDSVCNSYLGVGLSQNFALDNHMMSLLVGHEIGHNLGASHDGVAASPCSAAAYGFVMWPTLAADAAEEFSACSRNSITPVVDAAQCITAIAAVGCGNGVVDPGEECDDGNDTPGDCCRNDCLFDSLGTQCSDDADRCTDDTCDGAGYCRHLFNTAPCDDGDICTYDGICSSGSCLPQLNYRPLDKLRLRATVRPDIGNDGMIVSAGIFVDGLSSPPTIGGASIRVSDAAGAILYQATAPATLWKDATGLGASFVFRSNDQSARQTNGLASMSVKYQPPPGVTRIKAKVARADLSLLQGQSALSVRVQIGDEVLGDCGQVLVSACRTQGASLACR